MKKLKSFRMSIKTESQIADLAAFLGMDDTETISVAIDRMYKIEVSPFDQAQLRWQNWRNWFYDQMIHELRNAGKMDRFIAQIDELAKGFEHQTASLKEERITVETAQELYGAITILDTRIKQARSSHDGAALRAALADADQMIHIMGQHFIGAATPE